ncbi:MAG: hypothetical protein LBE74_08695 [Treponema sp.]|jgi:hypothetical protein|nr:hypothetical protein [Treponema sp.]
MIRRFYWLFLLSVASLSAQEEARVFFAQGADFALTSDGQRTIYQLENLQDLPVGKMDMIQTGPGGSVELRLSPSGILVKVLENTSLVYNGDTLEILYGRIRVKTPERQQKGLFIQARVILTYMAKGDMGFDFVVNPDTTIENEHPVLHVYTFTEKARLKFENIPELQIDEHELISVHSFPQVSLVERKPLDENSVNYWNRNNFRDGKPLIFSSRAGGRMNDVVTLPSEKAPVIQSPLYSAEEYASYRNKMKWKNVGFTLGSLLLTLGAGGQVVSNYLVQHGDRNSADVFTYFGYGFIWTGLIAVVTSAVINPPLPSEK